MMSFLAGAAALPLLADTPGPSGTYRGDDGGIYYVQQSGNVLWWAGMSLDTQPTPDLQWTIRDRSQPHCDSANQGEFKGVGDQVENDFLPHVPVYICRLW